MKTEVVEKLASLITAAFGIVAALAWNEPVRSLFVGPCGAENAGPLCYLPSWGPWVYAMLVTILAVIATLWIGKVAERVKNLQIRRKRASEAQAAAIAAASTVENIPLKKESPKKETLPKKNPSNHKKT